MPTPFMFVNLYENMVAYQTLTIHHIAAFFVALDNGIAQTQFFRLLPSGVVQLFFRYKQGNEIVDRANFATLLFPEKHLFFVTRHIIVRKRDL